jgi:hypothetical protein
MYLRVRNAPDWEVEGETTVEAVEEPVEEAEDDSNDASTTTSLNAMTKRELKAYLDELGVEYERSATKASLLESALSLDEEQ